MTKYMLRAILITSAFVGFGLHTQAQAQVKRSFNNLGFEEPVLATAGCRVYIADSQVPGWSTTHPAQATENVGACVVPGGFVQTAPIIEIWRTPRNNGSGGTVDAPEGVQIAELNAAVASRLYQNVCLINNEVVSWRFSHRGRGSATLFDKAIMGTALGPIVTVETTNNGTFNPPVVAQGTINPPVNIAGNATWVNYTGQFNYSGITGGTNIGFEAVGGTTSGNLLDNIQLQVAPFVEFIKASSSTIENSTNNIPTLRVNGTVVSAFTINVQITGGTAILGTDYTTPGNSSTLSINVPAGNYDGFSASSLFPLPITITNDTDIEGSENITFQIQPSGNAIPSYQLFSSTTCGAPGQITWDYTIIDDDQELVIIKNSSATAAVSGQPTQFDVTYTMLVNNPSALARTYGLIDTPSFDSNVSIVSAAFTLNASSSTSLSGSGPWVLQAPGKNLAAGATDTYILTVRANISRGNSSQAANDKCGTPSTAGSGLHNSATATLAGLNGNPSLPFTDTACTNTPTPVWVTLNKNLLGRITATDQVQIRVISGGIVLASAVTSGAASPTTAATSLLVVPAGETLSFSEAVKLNGAGADLSATAYTPSIVCSNAGTNFSGLPSGLGSSSGTNTLWSEFTPPSGADINCTITNSPLSADLRISKTNNATTLLAGTATSYSIVVTNTGPSSANNAVITDPATPGLSCTAVTCAAAGGASCPVGLTVAQLQSAGGAIIPVLPLNGSVTLQLTCDVSATGF